MRRLLFVLPLMWLLFAPAVARAQKLDPAAKKKAAAHYKQGKAYMDAGVYDKAVEEKQKREQADAHMKQAKAFLDAGAPADAAKEYVAAFDADGDPDHLFLAADAAGAAGDDKGARELYQRYLAAAPEGTHGDEAR